MMKELSSDFKEKIKQEKGPCIVAIYTPTCGVCKQVMPRVQEVEKEYGESNTFYKINAEKVPEVGEVYGVRSVPTLLFVQGGNIVKKHHGNISKEDIIETIEELFE